MIAADGRVLFHLLISPRVQKLWYTFSFPVLEQRLQLVFGGTNAIHLNFIFMANGGIMKAYLSKLLQFQILGERHCRTKHRNIRVYEEKNNNIKLSGHVKLNLTLRK